MATGDSFSEDSPAGAAAPGGPRAGVSANPAALAPAELARLLAVPEERVREHLAADAPTGPDGTVNLVHYVAWLNRELASRYGD